MDKVKLSGTIDFENLSEQSKQFLLGIHVIESKGVKKEINLASSSPQEGVAVYIRDGSDFIFVRGYSINPKLNTTFERLVKTSNLPLYRGGAIAHTIIEDAVLCAYDDRYGFAKPIGAGVAGYSEGEQLHRAAQRELLEELLLGQKTDMNTLLVPPGVIERFSKENLLAKPNRFVSGMTQVKEVGVFREKGYLVNEENRAFEGTAIWDTGLSIKDSYAIYMEPFPEGDIAGDAVMLVQIDRDPDISNLKAIGMARKGFVKFPMNLRKHPSVFNLHSLYKQE